MMLRRGRGARCRRGLCEHCCIVHARLHHSLRSSDHGCGRGKARTARTASTLIARLPAVATPAVSHEIESGAVMVWVRLIAACGMKCGVELKSQGRSTVTETCPSARTTTSASDKPGRGADDREREILDQHLLADVPPGPADGLQDRHFAPPLRHRCRGRAPHESRGESADDRRDDQSHALREKEHAAQRLPHRQFARHHALLAEQRGDLVDHALQLLAIDLDQNEIGVIGAERIKRPHLRRRGGQGFAPAASGI